MAISPYPLKLSCSSNCLLKHAQRTCRDLEPSTRVCRPCWFRHPLVPWMHHVLLVCGLSRHTALHSMSQSAAYVTQRWFAVNIHRSSNNAPVSALVNLPSSVRTQKYNRMLEITLKHVIAGIMRMELFSCMMSTSIVLVGQPQRH